MRLVALAGLALLLAMLPLTAWSLATFVDEVPRALMRDRHRWPTGARLAPVGKPRSRTDRHLADPANGERVPRCLACGVPGPIDVVGLRGGVPGRFPLCDRCWFTVNPPDPLDVSEIA